MDPVKRVVAPIIGLPSWNVKQGHGSFITLEFGEPDLMVREPQRRLTFIHDARTRTLVRPIYITGQWHLWIYCCIWSLTLEAVQIAHCESDKVEIARALSVLNGQSLTDLVVAPNDGTSTFHFDLGCVLSTWPAPPGVYDDPVEQWKIRDPEGKWLIIRGDGCYRYIPGNQTGDEGWEPLPSVEP